MDEQKLENRLTRLEENVDVMGEEFHVTSRHDILSGLELLSGLRVYFSLEVVG